MKKIDYEKALHLSEEYFNGSNLEASVFLDKYALKDNEGNLYEATPDDMHHRMASELYRIEQTYKNGRTYEEIYDSLKDFGYLIPQGSPMAAIGNPFQVMSLSNCFVVQNTADSYSGIMRTDEHLVHLMKRRAGVGTDISHLRPETTPVNNAARTSTGAVSFMERYSDTTREVAQSGRRGALMLTISGLHPDVEQFIDIKADKKSVTGANVSVRQYDSFLQAVDRGDTEFILHWPTDKPVEEAQITKVVNPQEIWHKLIFNVWDNAEPGLLFWDTILRESIPDCYADLGFKTVSTNPCIVGDTIISVADGRGDITIKQLAEENKDVPVYCYDEKGNVVIRYMRNPRITGYDEPIYKVTLEDGWTERVTGNHKFMLKNGEYKEAKDLVFGDSLQVMTKYEASLKDMFPGSNSKSQDYIWINNGNIRGSKSEHRIIAEFNNNTKIPKGHVVHHIDYNTRNNNPSNLWIMSKVAHDELHCQDMIGDKNPYHRMTDDWKRKFSESAGVLNGNYSGYTEGDLRKSALKLTDKLNCRFSIKEWREHAKSVGMPQHFSGWRQKQLNGNVISLAKWAAKELGLEKYSDVDPRLVKTYHRMLDEGYDAEIVGNQVIITKQCECCGTEIKHKHQQREVSLCSTKCHNIQMHSNTDIKARIKSTRTKTENERKGKVANEQVKIYSDLKFKLGRIPMLKEWILECKSLNVSSEIGRKSSPIENFNKLKEMAMNYNHKVVSVELDGTEDVYNGTVDEFHNFFIGGFETKTTNEKHKSLYINNLQCGEITLCDRDSCRLLAVNLFKFVVNPFTENAYFDWDKFDEQVVLAMRLMDDIIDLELEAVQKIINKIKADPEPDDIKWVELNLWETIKEKAEQGRRTGCGITALGDMVAAIGLTYGSDECNDFVEDLMMRKKHKEYESSIILAEERGAFPIWDPEREINNPFLLRLKSENEELWNRLQRSGRRNIAISTIAPTGTVSLMTQTSSGIENVFSIVYFRSKKVNPNDANVRVDYTDEMGDSWQEFPVFHPTFKLFLKINGLSEDEIINLTKVEADEWIRKSPYHGTTANDVDWVKKVEMQGRVQKHIDHSISVTVNLPKDISVDVVNDVYMTAWKSGCKGITAYRDECRTGVLNTTSKKDKQVGIVHSDAPKRPKSLYCDVYHTVAKGEQWTVFVGIMNEFPYEVFAVKGKYGKHKDVGEMVKIKSGHYNFVNGGVEDNITETNTDEEVAITRLISTSLRHGAKIDFVVEQLEKAEGSIVSFSKAIARQLKKYIDTTRAEKLIKDNPLDCPNDGDDCQIEYAESCLICKTCGTSKCA